MRVLITGSAGLIGSELGADFFGQEGSTRWNLRRLRETTRHYRHHELDVWGRAEQRHLNKGPCQQEPINLI
jgi:NAD dependent epimerase/dehydratase family enzyme